MRLSSSNSLTEGSLPRGILLFSLPLILSNILQVLFNMSDIAVVGQFAGSHALGSVGSTTIIVALFTNILIGVGAGVNVVVARYIGAKEDKNVSDTVHSSALICLLCGLALMMIGLLINRPLLELMGTKEELIDGAELYLRIYFCGMPALAIYNFGSGVLSASGNTGKPLVYMLTAGILNVILNLFFVIGFSLDVAGVAIASILSQYVSAALVLSALLRSNDVYAFRFAKLRFTKDKAKQVALLGISTGLQNAIFQAANLFVQAGVNTFDATTVEGNSAATNADALVYDVMAAFYVACSSFMSQNFGAHKKKRVRDSFFISISYALVIGLVMGVGIYLAGERFLHIFTKDDAVAKAGMARLSIMALSYGFSALMDGAIAASRGLGRSGVPTVIVIMGSCVFRIFWVYTVFAHFGTIQSLYLVYISSWTITAIAELLYFRYVYKKIVSPLPDSA